MFRDLKGLRPGNARHLGCLGNALKDKGLSREAGEMLEAAVAAGREAIRLKPDDALRPQQPRQRPEESGQARRGHRRIPQAIRLKPDDAEAHNNLGDALRDQGKLDEAIAEYREAIRLKPDDAEAHNNLGIVLRGPGQAGRGHRRIPRGHPARARLRRGPQQPRQRPAETRASSDEAIACYRKAIELDPKLRHGPLQPRQRPAEARASWTRPSPPTARPSNSTRTSPRPTTTSAPSCEPGEAGRGHRRYRKAIELDPKLRRGPQQPRQRPAATRGKLDEAIACYRKAIELDPKLRQRPTYNLGNALSSQGQAGRGHRRLPQGHPNSSPTTPRPTATWARLARPGPIRRGPGGLRARPRAGPETPDWPYPSAEWVARPRRAPRSNRSCPPCSRARTNPTTTTNAWVWPGCARPRSSTPPPPASTPTPSPPTPSWPTTARPGTATTPPAPPPWPPPARARTPPSSTTQRAHTLRDRPSTGSGPT